MWAKKGRVQKQGPPWIDEETWKREGIAFSKEHRDPHEKIVDPKIAQLDP